MLTSLWRVIFVLQGSLTDRCKYSKVVLFVCLFAVVGVFCSIGFFCFVFCSMFHVLDFFPLPDPDFFLRGLSPCP